MGGRGGLPGGKTCRAFAAAFALRPGARRTLRNRTRRLHARTLKWSGGAKACSSARGQRFGRAVAIAEVRTASIRTARASAMANRHRGWPEEHSNSAPICLQMCMLKALRRLVDELAIAEYWDMKPFCSATVTPAAGGWRSMSSVHSQVAVLKEARDV